MIVNDMLSVREHSMKFRQAKVLFFKYFFTC